jgi:DNA-binding IclR family transcriptional regulator
LKAADPVRALARAPVVASTRSLSTARSVLKVLALLVERPTGVRAEEVAEELGKSTSTAYYLLSSLCEEGFAVHEAKGVYRAARNLHDAPLDAEREPIHQDVWHATVEELFTLTRRRSYLGVVRSGRIEITAFRGRQGVPRMPGLGSEIRDSAHALAMGKVVLAQLDASGVARYAAMGLRAFTPQTITSPERLAVELERTRRVGFAVDREEFDRNFCCIAAPIRDRRGRFAAVLGMSMGPSVFDARADDLAEALQGVAERATPAAPVRSLPRRRSQLSQVS